MGEGASGLAESANVSWHRRWQDGLLEGAVGLFALWTLASHLTVAVGGTLRTLEGIFLGLVSIGGVSYVFVKRRQHKGVGPGISVFENSPSSDSTSHDSPAMARLRWIGVAAGLVATLGIAWTRGQFLWWWVAVPLTVAAAVLLRLEPREPIELRPPVAGRRDLLPWGLALLVMGLTLLAHRHDSDDSIYVNLAVSAVDHPDRPILTGDTMHGLEDLPLHLPLYKLHSYEMLCAALSRWTGWPAIASFHIAAAAGAAFLLPLAFARFFRLLTPLKWPWMLLFFLVVLVAVGHPHRWYGNFAFVRLWQGKSLFLFLALPLIYVSALSFGAVPSLRAWLRLVTVQVAALGLSATALTHAPIAAVVGVVAAVRPDKSGLLRLAAGAASSFYLVAAGLLIRNQAMDTLPLVPRNAGSGSGDKLLEAFMGVVGGGALQSVALLALLSAWALTRSPLARRFALLGSLTVWLTVLNPFFEPLAVRYVTGTLYWRSLWMVPIPFMMTLLLTSPIDLFRRRPIARKLGAVGLLAAFVALLPGPHGLSEENRVRLLSLPELKIHPATYDWALELQRVTGPGSSVVAPERVGLWIPTLHHHAFPLSVSHYLKMQRRHLPPDEWRQRNMMTRFVDGQAVDPEEAAREFRLGLERFEVRGVCLRVARNDQVETAREILEAAGFRRGRMQSDFEIWYLRGQRP